LLYLIAFDAQEVESTLWSKKISAISRISKSLSLITITLSLNSPVLAVPLGSHTNCAYPTCTSQLDILEASAPGLVPNGLKIEQIEALKVIKSTLGQFPQFYGDKVQNFVS
jgi:hypothetical protein